MKDSELLMLGGGALLLLVMAKKANATTAQATTTGGKPQAGVNYATPTNVAGVVAGAVNGILNWISGTPAAPASTTKAPQVDDLSTIWQNAQGAWSTYGGGLFGTSGNDSSVNGSNPQDGSQLQLTFPSLANFTNAGAMGLQ